MGDQFNTNARIPNGHEILRIGNIGRRNHTDKLIKVGQQFKCHIILLVWDGSKWPCMENTYGGKPYGLIAGPVPEFSTVKKQFESCSWISAVAHLMSLGEKSIWGPMPLSLSRGLEISYPPFLVFVHIVQVDDEKLKYMSLEIDVEEYSKIWNRIPTQNDLIYVAATCFLMGETGSESFFKEGMKAEILGCGNSEEKTARAIKYLREFAVDIDASVRMRHFKRAGLCLRAQDQPVFVEESDLDCYVRNYMGGRQVYVVHEAWHEWNYEVENLRYRKRWVKMSEEEKKAEDKKSDELCDLEKSLAIYEEDWEFWKALEALPFTERETEWACLKATAKAEREKREEKPDKMCL